MDQNYEYKQRLVNWVLEITADIRLLDKDILLAMYTEDIERLGKSLLEGHEILADIQEKKKPIAELIVKKRDKVRADITYLSKRK